MIPFGLQNVGNTCWLNSLTQFLISSDVFNEEMQNLYMNADQLTPKQKVIVREFAELKDKKDLSREFIKQMSNFDISSSQKCADEAFHLMMDVMPISLKKKIITIHKNIIACKCGEISEVRDAKYLTLGMSNIEETIIKSKSPLFDYKCKCSKEVPYIYSKLLYIGDILILNLNKTAIKIPSTLKIKTVDGILVLKLVSTIDHMGNAYGGHYISRGVRDGNTYTFNDNSFFKLSTEIEATKNTILAMYSK